MQIEPAAVEDLERVRRVTTSFRDWQGLRLVCLGLVLLALDIPKIPWLGRTAGGVLGLLLLTLALPGVFWVDRYYRRTFGDVKYGDEKRRESRGAWFGLLIVLLMATATFVRELHLLSDSSLRTFQHYRTVVFFWAYSLGYLIAVATCVVAWRREARWDLLALAAFLAAALVLAMGAGIERGRQILSIVVGPALIVEGLLSHRLLMRGLKPLPAEGDEGPV